MNTQQLTRLKIAGTYLAIIMLMSLSFSVAIYQISDRELTGQRRIQLPIHGNLIISEDEFDILRDAQLRQARANLRQKIISFNLMTLIIGAVLSYYLAIRSLKPIEDALERQDRFTSDASHEIKTPLTAMRSEIEIALRDKNLPKEEYKKVLESNLEEITRLNNLTDGLLKLARQENTSLEKSRLNLNDLVDQAINQTKAESSKKMIQVTSAVPPKLNIHVEPVSFSQVLVIALDNAIKYSPKKSEIKVSAKNTRTSTEIEVIDQGVGIDSNDLPYVFERFYRSDKSRTKTDSSQGFGLGLAIAKEIVTAHEGQISISNNSSGGTKLTVSLPKK